MNKFESYSRVVPWFMALLLSALAAGCGGTGGVAALAPMVTVVAPLPKASGVPINTKIITAAFTEAMDPDTLTPASFTLACPAGTPVTGVVSYLAAGNMATLTLPAATNLPPSTVCTATVTTASRDTTGLSLANDFIWTFMTGAAPIVPPAAPIVPPAAPIVPPAAPIVPPAARNYSAWSDQGIVYTAPAGAAYYPNVLYDRNGFGGAATHAMWYTDGSGAAFRVSSSNGTSWSAPVTTTGLGGRAHHVQVLYDANHFGRGPSGPSYRMWYWDIGAPLYDISAMATAESTDGVNWISNTALTQDPSAQLVTGAGTGWNRGSYGPVDLFYQANAANAGADPWSYSYVMYYDGTDGSREETGLAYSTDGVSWKAYASNPTLPASASPAWDSNDSVYGTVYRDAVGFHYWYSGGVSSPSEGIGYAFSSDGRTWTKNSTPVFQISDGASYRSSRTYTPSVIDNGSGTLTMYYTAVGADGVKRIGRAILPP